MSPLPALSGHCVMSDLVRFGGKADVGRAPRELSLFLPRVLFRENRVPVFLVGRGDRFLAFAAAIVGRCSGGCLSALGLGYGFTGSAFDLRSDLFFWSGLGFGFFVVAGHRLS